MPWIEYLLHIDPDHGSGSLEATIGFCLIAAALVALSAHRHRA